MNKFVQLYNQALTSYILDDICLDHPNFDVWFLQELKYNSRLTDWMYE